MKNKESKTPLTDATWETLYEKFTSGKNKKVTTSWMLLATAMSFEMGALEQNLKKAAAEERRKMNELFSSMTNQLESALSERDALRAKLSKFKS